MVTLVVVVITLLTVFAEVKNTNQQIVLMIATLRINANYVMEITLPTLRVVNHKLTLKTLIVKPPKNILINNTFFHQPSEQSNNELCYPTYSQNFPLLVQDSSRFQSSYSNQSQNLTA